MNLQVFSGRANPALSQNIAKALGIPLGKVAVKAFPDGELLVKYTQNIRGDDIFIIQPTCNPPSENLVELLIMLDAAKRASAKRITAVLPYYGFARQDRKDQPRVPITAKLVANLLVSAGAHRILAMDLHSQQIQGFFDIPVDHLYAAPVFIRYLRKAIDMNNCMIVSPDSGGVKMAHAYATEMHTGLAIAAKRRIDPDTVSMLHLVGDVKGRDCVLVDDMTTTAGTLCGAAAKLKEAGAKRVFAAVSHCCLTDEGHVKLRDSDITELVTTDSVPQQNGVADSKIKVLSVAGLLGKAIKRIHKDQSVSSLFRVQEETSSADSSEE
ncbi:MAG: ribose-phosphate pyrophosphokinase [Lentisphaeria bacterium]